MQPLGYKSQNQFNELGVTCKILSITEKVPGKLKLHLAINLAKPLECHKITSNKIFATSIRFLLNRFHEADIEEIFFLNHDTNKTKYGRREITKLVKRLDTVCHAVKTFQCLTNYDKNCRELIVFSIDYWGLKMS